MTTLQDLVHELLVIVFRRGEEQLISISGKRQMMISPV